MKFKNRLILAILFVFCSSQFYAQDNFHLQNDFVEYPSSSFASEHNSISESKFQKGYYYFGTAECFDKKNKRGVVVFSPVGYKSSRPNQRKWLDQINSKNTFGNSVKCYSSDIKIRWYYKTKSQAQKERSAALARAKRSGKIRKYWNWPLN